MWWSMSRGISPPRWSEPWSRLSNADPSASQESLEGSLQQMLLLMNDRTLHGSLAKKSAYERMHCAPKRLTMSSIPCMWECCKKADSRRAGTGAEHLRQSASRPAAIDDLLWVLVNSTEFLQGASETSQLCPQSPVVDFARSPPARDFTPNPALIPAVPPATHLRLNESAKSLPVNLDLRKTPR